MEDGVKVTAPWQPLFLGLDHLLVQVALAAGQFTSFVQQSYPLPQSLYCFTTSRCQYSRNKSDPKFTLFSRMSSFILNWLPVRFPWFLFSPSLFSFALLHHLNGNAKHRSLSLLVLFLLSLGLFLFLDYILFQWLCMGNWKPDSLIARKRPPYNNRHLLSHSNDFQ